MAKREKLPSFTTPVMTFQYPKLTKPDYGSDEFPKPDGEFNVKGVMPKDVAVKWLEEKGIQDLQDAAVKAGKEEYKKLAKAKRDANPFKVHPLFAIEYDDDENETGNVVMNFKMKASGKSKKDGSTWKRKPSLFDAKGKRMTNVDAIWGGTTGKVSFSAASFFTMVAGAGIAKFLNAVQIIDLVSEGGMSADAYGFGEEDGYEHDDAAAGSDAESDDEDASDAGEEDF